MTMMAITVGAQTSPKVYSGQPETSSLKSSSLVQKPFQAVAPRQDLKTRLYAPQSKKLTLDAAKVKPVTRSQRTLMAAGQMENALKGKVQNSRRLNLQPMMSVNAKASAQTRAAKAPAFAESYTAMGVNYETKDIEQWKMIPSQASMKDPETGETITVDVFVDIIPTPDFLSQLYPEGIPVQYTIDDDNVITIKPQSVAMYEDDGGNTNYITLFSANSDDEDGIINMSVDENGKLTITNGNWICFGEFANVPFDEEMSDGEAYLGWDALYANVTYYLKIESSIDQEYKAHGVDYFANTPVDWIMQRGTTTLDNEESHFFVNMTPLTEVFQTAFPEGIDVAYEQEGNIITVQPQVIAAITDEEGKDEYIMLCSGTSEDGCVVLTEGTDGSLATIENESIIIGAWSTSKFDESFDTYLGSYSYIDNVKYRLPNAAPEAPKDVAFEPNELVLFAGMGPSGYQYSNNLAAMGAYTPLTFRNNTFDIATNFEWSVNEEEEEETTITGSDRDFSFNSKGGAVYSEFTLTAFNETEKSEPFKWGVGHEYDPEESNAYFYAGAGQGGFQFTDGTYATMTRQNPDNNLTFYINWATPDITAENGASTVSKIYSYQGKPSTPLFITGVSLPVVSFAAQDNFNLHIGLYKCSRSNTGSLTMGELIAEGDATIDNVITDYAETVGLSTINFNELYVVDELGLSETLDYLFIEDEFVIVIDGWDNGTFSGVLGSNEETNNELTSTWFERPGESRLRSYGGGWPTLFIGLNDATYGYLYTEDDTNLQFGAEGGEKSIHIYPMYYSVDDETETPTYLLDIESITVDGEEAEEVPEWLQIEVANEDYTTGTKVDEDGDEYTYFVNGIDYDLVFNVAPLADNATGRSAEISFFQTGARVTVSIAQGDKQGISTVVTKTTVADGRTYNVAGQKVKGGKGLILKDGKKYIIK